jgi:hypothetical protein
LRFEAENGRALDGRDIYLRDEKTKLPVSHPRSWYARRLSSVTVVFLKKSVSFEISPSAIFVAPQVGEEEADIAVLSTLESCPESSALVDGAARAAGT